MFEITLSASTSNLGSGFDAVGMALSLLNTYRFQPADSYMLINFDKRFMDHENLVMTSYRKTIRMLGEDDCKHPVMITEVSRQIPVSRGLGSSSACIVAGIVGAYLILGIPVDKRVIMEFATTIEGHPDNVTPVIYGGMQTVIMTDSKQLVRTQRVSSKLHFLLLVPDVEIKTITARSVLPPLYTRADVVFALSRALLLTDAFQSGDMSLVRIVFEDLIHEPYRYPLIPYGREVKDYMVEKGGAVAISGSGPTLFVVSDKPLEITADDLLIFGSWQVIRTELVGHGFQIQF